MNTVWDWQEQNRRPTWDELFMMLAETVSTRSTCDRGPKQRFREHKGTGAVIVTPDKKRIAIGYCGSPPGLPHCDTAGHFLIDGHCVRTLHAEENAILNASFDLKGCALYTTTMPCYDCCKRIVAVGIRRVLYQHIYISRYEVVNAGLDMLSESGIVCEVMSLRTENE